ncbi:MAG: carbamoyltransferase HypF [Candidatus Heimdallarchaeota archaeon]|nr:carbamoyltransferase HypF [Candidatus Heimdallarchaeota archaeon]
MSNKSLFHIQITGVVQSVGFRPFIKNLADDLRISGYVRNLASAGVEIVMQGSRSDAEKFLVAIEERKPELALILNTTLKQLDESEIEFSNSSFIIVPSKEIHTDKGISPLPPDIAICSACSGDQKEGRRKNYSFISCTDCGPRYSAIRRVPYDRINTAFGEFPLCNECEAEYTQPKDRRFHAQTTCCPFCGPHYEEYHKNLEIKIISDWANIRRALEMGEIWAIMGQGGTHLVTNAHHEPSVGKLRYQRRKQSDKPFAVMMRDIESVKKYCYTTEADVRHLISARRPILVLRVREPGLWKEISPGLQTLGVMLPYSSMHHLLFDDQIDCLLMTSANLPGLPMPITPDEVISQLTSLVDGMLLHNRPIIQRVDDSVLRSQGDHHLIIRRSRGFVPQPLFHKDLQHLRAFAAGAEENVTISFAKDGWIIPSQHLGHIVNIESQRFMQDTIEHLRGLYHLDFEHIIADYHPNFISRSSAQELASIHQVHFHTVQHHVAHVASLAFDQQIPHDESILAWACDGFGLGTDNNAWGSELILLQQGEWKRLGSTCDINYNGGDRNSIHPARMLLHYLTEIDFNVEQELKSQILHNLKGGEVEYKYITQSPKNIITSSLARLFDSVASLLDVAQFRSYRGEPAIKLEDLALYSDKSFSINPDAYITTSEIPLIDTRKIFEEVMGMYRIEPRKHIAKFTHDAVAQTMASLGREVANDLGISSIGFTGGIAYNKIITDGLRQTLGNALLLHKQVPPGDAGISIGQLNYLGMRIEK